MPTQVWQEVGYVRRSRVGSAIRIFGRTPHAPSKRDGADSCNLFGMVILSSFDAYEHLRTKLTSDVEEFWAVALRIDQSVISSDCIFRGTVDSCTVHPRDIFRYACLRNASRILIAHNHPTGDPNPSEADLLITRRLIRASLLLQIPIVDHIILGWDRYSSLADLGLLRTVSRPGRSGQKLI